MISIAEKSILGKQIAEKRYLLRKLYGGVMSSADLDRELGYKSKGRGAAWAKMVGVEPIQISPKRRGYETDEVAAAIVRGRSAI